MKVAYADNDIGMLEKVETYLREYCRQRNEDFTIDLFIDPYKLVKNMATEIYDLFIVAVVFPEQKVSGLEISNKARRYAPYIPVIFIEPTENDNAEVCFILPQRFELMPFSKHNFDQIMDNIYTQIITSPLGTINVTDVIKKNNEKINIHEIVYAESSGKNILLYMYSGKCIQTEGPIKNFAEKLSYFAEFLFPHKSFIVNSRFISKIQKKSIYLKTNSLQIPIARGKLQSVQESYIKYLKNIIKESSVFNNLSAIKSLSAKDVELL